MALVTPVLVFLMLVAVDYARIFHLSTTLANCARNGALWESDPYTQAESPHKNLRDAALADAASLSETSDNPLVVTSKTGTDDTGNPYVEVTVKQRFRSVSNFPGIPNDVDQSRTVRMARAPMNPTR